MFSWFLLTFMDSRRVERYDGYKVMWDTEGVAVNGYKSTSFADGEQIDFNAFLNVEAADRQRAQQHGLCRICRHSSE